MGTERSPEMTIYAERHIFFKQLLLPLIIICSCDRKAPFRFVMSPLVGVNAFITSYPIALTIIRDCFARSISTHLLSKQNEGGEEVREQNLGVRGSTPSRSKRHVRRKKAKRKKHNSNDQILSPLSDDEIAEHVSSTYISSAGSF